MILIPPSLSVFVCVYLFVFIELEKEGVMCLNKNIDIEKNAPAQIDHCKMK